MADDADAGEGVEEEDEDEDWPRRGSNLQVSSFCRALPVKNVCWQHVAEDEGGAAEEADEGVAADEEEAVAEDDPREERCCDGAKSGCADDCVCRRVLTTSKGVTARRRN